MARPVPPSIQVTREGSTLRPTRSPALTFAVGGATMRAGWPSMEPVRSRCDPIGSTTRTSKGMPEPFGRQARILAAQPELQVLPVAGQGSAASPIRAAPPAALRP